MQEEKGLHVQLVDREGCIREKNGSLLHRKKRKNRKEQGLQISIGRRRSQNKGEEMPSLRKRMHQGREKKPKVSYGRKVKKQGDCLTRKGGHD